jgi:TPR repeat protein
MLGRQQTGHNCGKNPMRIVKRLFAICVSTLLLSAAGTAFATSYYSTTSYRPSGLDSAAFRSNDPPGNFFPGKYFEYKAQFYLKKKDYREALDMFELAGFWADKVAQYNAGLMHYNGIGVPVDRITGVAWLGIAAEAHDDLAVNALEVAYASLSVAERKQAEVIWRALDGKYGDAVSLPRALRRFHMEATTMTGSHLGFLGNLQVYETGPGSNPLGESGFRYYGRQGDERDALIGRITGHVTVGAVAPLKVSADASTNASSAPLDGSPVK